MARGIEVSAGDVLDRRYRLVSRLGKGGFGDVWRAEELLPDGAPFRDVALKLLLGGPSDAIDWAEEAKLLASFRHPSLVTIYAAGILEIDPPQRFVAMELLEGQNLAEVIRARGKIAWRRVLKWAAATAHALDVIHARGVVHLDLKPANLFLTTDGALKVLDFGIARKAGAHLPRVNRPGEATHVDPLSTREQQLPTAAFVAEQDVFAATRPLTSEERSSANLVIGTPGFMAPEILEQGDPTAAADAYALAVCMVQLATGHLPHAAPDEPTAWDDPTAVSGWLAELRAATLRGSLKSFELGPTPLPRGVVALIRRLLEVDPKKRNVVAGHLGALLDEVNERPHGAPNPPYFGLSPLPFEAEGVLFGRDDDIARLGRELEFDPCVVLQGGRGVGKTSLARAGLVPYLARRGIDDRDDWMLVEVKPGDDPDRALAEALALVSPDLEAADPEVIFAWCDSTTQGLAILVDPLDEVVKAPPSRRERLSDLMIAIATRAVHRGLRLVATIAEENVAALLEAGEVGAALRASLRFVGAPSTAAVRDLVGAPAHFAGCDVFGIDAAAADVQHELRAEATRLPYVAIALRAFWDLREPLADAPPQSNVPSSRGDAVMILRGERWVELGGIKGALARHADRVMAQLDPEKRRVADEILVNLSASDGKKVVWSEEELLRSAGGAKLARTILEMLIRERLVTRQGGEVEIGHEALLVAWPHLASVRLHDMERLVFLERLREAAQAWDRGERATDLLLNAVRLREVRERGSADIPGLGPRELELIDASKRRNRLRIAARLAIALAVVLGVAGIVLFQRSSELERIASEQKLRAAAHHEYVTEMASKSRRTEDPFHRTAYIAEAMSEHSVDGLLALDLATAASNVPHATFLTLDSVTGANFPWDDRFLLALGSGGTLAIVDFKSKEPETIEDVPLDADPEAVTQHRFKKPVLHELRPHGEPIVERTVFAFDSAFATRSVSGEVKVFRLRDDGTIALAAIAPMRCTGAMVTAEAAPVLACSTDAGISRWDLRLRGEASVSTQPFQGRVTDVSWDGDRVAAALGKHVLLWLVAERRKVEIENDAPVLFASWSPRDRLVALVAAGRYSILDPDSPTSPVMRGSSSGAPASARWDDGGLDLGICGPNQIGEWHYLRNGGRAKDDPAPKRSACAPQFVTEHMPEPLTNAADFDEIADHELGPHPLQGGFRVSRHRYLSRDLVLFDASAESAQRLLRFQGKDDAGTEEDRQPLDSVVSVERDGDSAVAVQVGTEIRVYSLPDGKRFIQRKGNLLRRCDDGRLLSWIADHDRWNIFEAWHGAEIASLEHEPGFVLAADGACGTVYTQTLEGNIVATSVAPGDKPVSRTIARADGYVYEARPTPARGDVPAGLLLALSSGAIARIDEGSDRVRVLGYATPRATAIADGPEPGDVAYADASGVVILRRSGAIERVFEGTSSSWEDLSIARDGMSMLLASGDRIAVLDLGRHEILGAISNEGRSRFSPWDNEGSIIAWSFDRLGGAEGIIIPRGVTLARQVAKTVSNLEIDHGRLSLRR